MSIKERTDQQVNYCKNTVMHLKCLMYVISLYQPTSCNLSLISCACLTWVAILDRFFQQRANRVITERGTTLSGRNS